MAVMSGAGSIRARLTPENSQTFGSWRFRGGNDICRVMMGREKNDGSYFLMDPLKTFIWIERRRSAAGSGGALRKVKDMFASVFSTQGTRCIKYGLLVEDVPVDTVLHRIALIFTRVVALKIESFT
ncbi:hypothetical protein Zmor_020231 [Zophobas morio]|uniref:Uncharacterized protein n=1 Tax=Zophobas morio TaxID=2755281 RepID=A0AA38M9R4_9CUCU|nr:hypothetical protein Zmor_020231 [Zophobas morio]